MTANTTTEPTPRAWVGCLACYNSGRLVGEWLDADALENVEELEAICSRPDHEELWCFDTEFGGEMSPAEAALWARAYADAIERTGLPVEVVRGFIEHENTTAATLDTLAERIEDQYEGEHSTDADYAYDYAESVGALPCALETPWPLCSINWHEAAQELDFFTVTDSNYARHYFRTY